MNTPELIAIVAQMTEQPRESVEDCVRTALAVIAGALSDHEVVKLAGLGRMQVRQVGVERLVRLAPHLPERYIAPHAVHFRPNRRLRAEIDFRAGEA
ncbi:MAG: HU family DNA-binding protein [Candidatus Accumulibacter phosphatis]|uniref:Integration host factor subunit beta n=1 Tax=Candidatus Accumulibacter contiguus TaxID=2954381 RepID=A0ABX1T8Y9_9PROT|nr:HU family DNA-binding protein [Candidatus Accumulibacter contiguus]NMQ05267.1 hypothetical protein [Candidatus Accumulibacter contiguus]